jgi:hypothetical protein
MESSSHKRIKNKIAGKSGKTEFVLKNKKRIDVVKKREAYEVEKSQRILYALKKLKKMKTYKTVLRVPQSNLKTAIKKALKIGFKGKISNLSGTKYRYIK